MVRIKFCWFFAGEEVFNAASAADAAITKDLMGDKVKKKGNKRAGSNDLLRVADGQEIKGYLALCYWTKTPCYKTMNVVSLM